jgi:hypothetical protein
LNPAPFPSRECGYKLDEAEQTLKPTLTLLTALLLASLAALQATTPKP